MSAAQPAGHRVSFTADTTFVGTRPIPIYTASCTCGWSRQLYEGEMANQHVSLEHKVDVLLALAEMAS